MVLSREQLFLSPMVTGPVETCSYEQYQPNGIDLTIARVESFRTHGKLLTDTKVLPGTTPLFEGLDSGSVWLPRGEYLITFNETINLPNDVMAYILPRSSLLRMGVAIHGAVWDAGYHGQGSSLLVVYNEHGWNVGKNARVAQLVFHRLEQPTGQGYDGSYQHEGLPEGLVVDEDGDLSIENPTADQVRQFVGLMNQINDGSYLDDPGNPQAHSLCFDQCYSCSDSRACIYASDEEKRQIAEIEALKGQTFRVVLHMPAEDYPDFKRFQMEDSWAIESAETYLGTYQSNFDRQVEAMGESIKAGPLYRGGWDFVRDQYKQLSLPGMGTVK